jgi:hypothetical protein
MREFLERTFSFGKHAVPRTRLGKFLEFQGYLYLSMGFGLLAVPQLFVLIGLVPAFGNSTEQAYFRSVGFTVGLVGYLYVTTARMETKNFEIASVFDRWFIVPPVLIILMALSLPIPVGIFFICFDGGLGTITYFVIRKTKQEQGPEVRL